MNCHASKHKLATNCSPAQKKRQLSITNFCQPSTSTEGLTTTTPKELILVPKALTSKPKRKPPEGLKMYSEHEIDAVDGLLKDVSIVLE